MTSQTTFHRVFDVSDRIPDAILGWLALTLLGLIVVLMFVVTFRRGLLRRWWLAPTVAVPIFLVVALRELGLWFVLWGLGFVAVGITLELRGKRIRWSPLLGGSEAPRGSIGVMAGLVLLVLAAFGGVSQTAAVSLSQQLQAGQAIVLTGQVQGYTEVAPAGKNDCFKVEDRRFCVSNWVMTPGFRETRFSRTLLKEGEVVRLSVIGDDIVRVEVEQATPG